MAIYHFSGQVISRSQGRGVVSSAAYRSAEKLHDEKQDRTFDYSRKDGVFYKEVLLPDGAPSEFENREVLWNAVESSEKRKDAQLAREFNFALPKELTPEQNTALAKEFVQNEFVNKGMIADLCVHLGHASNQDQPHAHVMLTMREVTEEGFGKKNREWNDRAQLSIWRESWAEHQNRHLALADIEQRVDHRSYEKQGIDLEPQYKIGTAAARDKMARYEDHQRIARENGEKIYNHPEIALNAITRQQSTFTHKDIARFVNRHTENAEQFQRVFEKIKQSDQLISLGVEEYGRERFTTHELHALEKTMLNNAQVLAEQNAHTVSFSSFASSVPDYLSPSQVDALKHITTQQDLSCVVGYAGTGKSALLNVAREGWEREGYNVRGATLSGIAAESLAGSSGIESRTVASYLYAWDRGRDLLTSKSVLVVDEAGMLGSRQMARLVQEVKDHEAKLVLVGDPQQLQAIEAGAAFRMIAEHTNIVELTHIQRQKENWQKEATKDFAEGRVEQAFDRYDKHDNVHEYETQALAKQSLLEMWNDARINRPDQTQIILAATRKDVRDLNEQARELRKEQGELGKEAIFFVDRGDARHFAENDRLYFLRNDRELGVKNGTLGTVEKINGDDLTIRLDRDAGGKEQREIVVDTRDYDYLDYGYAATIHKAQSVTVDRSYILTSCHMDSHSSYTAMSRHRESADLFWSREEFAEKRDLIETLERDRSKDTSLDYAHLSKERDQTSQDYTLVQEIEQSLKDNLKETAEEARFVKDINPRSIASDDPLESFKVAYEEKQLNNSLQSFKVSNAQCFENDPLSSFKSDYETSHPRESERMQHEMQSVPEQYGSEAQHEFALLERELEIGKTPGSTLHEIEQYARELSNDQLVMNYLEKNDPQMVERIHNFVEPTHELSRSREEELERDEGLSL